MSYPHYPRGPPVRGGPPPMGYGHPTGQHGHPYYGHPPRHPGGPAYGYEMDYRHAAPSPQLGLRMAPPNPSPPHGMGGGYVRTPSPQVPSSPSVQGMGRGRGGYGSSSAQSGSESDTGKYGSGTESDSRAASSSREVSGKSPFANDCEIIVLNKAQQQYAEKLERDLRQQTGLKVDLMFPKADIKLGEFLKPIAKLGTIFAIVVDKDGETQQTVNFYQFRGVPKPQYHKNVPLYKAFNLLSTKYEELRSQEIGPVTERIKSTVSKLLEERNLLDSEYTELIVFLQERRKRQHAFMNRTNDKVTPKQDISSLAETNEGKELQKRILAILNES